MKILISASNFMPDPIGVGKFTGEMAEWLAARGHDVRVITAPPFYPRGKISEGYSGWTFAREKYAGLDILRCPIWVAKKQSGARRLLQGLSFAFSSMVPLLWSCLFWRPDVVWTVAPSLPSTAMAMVGAKLAGRPCWIHIQDFEIDAAFELGLLRSSWLRGFLEKAERFLLSRFNIVSTITPRMLERLDAKKIASRKKLFPNWVDPDIIFPVQDNSPARARLGIGDRYFVALYSGNLGEKQGVHDLVEVARLLSDEKEALVLICGDGAGRARLSGLARGLENLRLLPLRPAAEFNDLLGAADVHLLPQKPEVADLVMPSKLLAMLASGRPVIAGAKDGTQLADEIDGCGIVVPPGDAARMADAIRLLKSRSDLRDAMGQAGIDRVQSRWAKSRILLQ
ncbi:MAG TPA: WcaI family glycosyltransferase, partial [Rhizomicrobium sp.]|nr:WcaI family glycosyltransferase [Rhizomicrobium sp.]